MNLTPFFSEATLQEDQQSIEVRPASGLFVARISTVKTEARSSTVVLLIHLEHEAASPEEADSSGRDLIEKLLALLAFTSGATFSDPVLRFVVDWSEGTGLRDLHLFTRPDQLLEPTPLLGKGVADSVSSLLQENVSPAIWRALAWYRSGLRADTPDLQVQCFWLCLETLVTDIKETEKVADECQKCRSPLFCQTCNQTSTHRPFVKQKIKRMLERHRPDGGATFEEASVARNILMHGGTLIGPRDGNPFPYVHLVSKMGEAAWTCVIHQLTLSAPEGTDYELFVPSSYTRRHFRAVSRFKLPVPLEDGKLLVKNVPRREVSLTREGNLMLVKMADESGQMGDVPAEAIDGGSNGDGGN